MASLHPFFCRSQIGHFFLCARSNKKTAGFTLGGKRSRRVTRVDRVLVFHRVEQKDPNSCVILATMCYGGRGREYQRIFCSGERNSRCSVRHKRGIRARWHNDRRLFTEPHLRSGLARLPLWPGLGDVEHELLPQPTSLLAQSQLPRDQKFECLASLSVCPCQGLLQICEFRRCRLAHCRRGSCRHRRSCLARCCRRRSSCSGRCSNRCGSLIGLGILGEVSDLLGLFGVVRPADVFGFGFVGHICAHGVKNIYGGETDGGGE